MEFKQISGIVHIGVNVFICYDQLKNTIVKPNNANLDTTMYIVQPYFSVEDIVKAFLSPKPDVSMKDVVRKNAVTCKIANTV